MNLYHEFTEIVKQSRDRDLYQLSTLMEEFICSPEKETASKFLSECFNRKVKGGVINSAGKIFDNINERSMHTGSAYLLGLHLSSYFQECFNQVLYQDLQKRFEEVNKNNNMDYASSEMFFEYLWRLACQFHDIGTKSEQKKRPTKLKDIKYSIFQNFGLDSVDIPQYDAISSTHPEELVEKYYNYRGQYDHGIAAGIEYFELLVKNHIEQWEDYQSCSKGNKMIEDRNETINCFTVNNSTMGYRIHFGEDVIRCYAYAADAIIAHNMWYLNRNTASPDEIYKYESDGLRELIYDKNCVEDNRISAEEHPLAFYLGFIDSIEPVKFFNNINPKAVWEMINMEYRKQSNVQYLVISQNGNELNFNEWYQKKMKEMSTWLKIDPIEEPKDNIIRIKLPALEKV